MADRILVRGAEQVLTLRGGPGPRRGPEMRELGIIKDGAVLVENGRIVAVGTERQVSRAAGARGAQIHDLPGGVLMPGFVDSHTHLVHAAPRLRDYETRTDSGGILATVQAVRECPAERLARRARESLRVMRQHGTTTVEAKSGYGLNEEAELKQLSLAVRYSLVSTFLGAHVTPPEFAGRAGAYVDWLIADLMPKVARGKLARYADVYCDAGAFSVDEARRYLLAARALGLELRIHASQSVNFGAVQLAVELGAVSADHLEAIGPAEIRLLAESPVIATLLPGSVFHLGLTRYAPARELIDAGAAVALATDFNPGTSPTPSMPMIIALACTQMRMTPAEAICASTINGAHALGLAAETGSIEVGKRAEMVVLELSDYRELPYAFGVNPVFAVVNGSMITIN